MLLKQRLSSNIAWNRKTTYVGMYKPYRQQFVKNYGHDLVSFLAFLYCIFSSTKLLEVDNIKKIISCLRKHGQSLHAHIFCDKKDMLCKITNYLYYSIKVITRFRLYEVLLKQPYALCNMHSAYAGKNLPRYVLKDDGVFNPSYQLNS